MDSQSFPCLKQKQGAKRGIAILSLMPTGEATMGVGTSSSSVCDAEPRISSSRCVCVCGGGGCRMGVWSNKLSISAT